MAETKQKRHPNPFMSWVREMQERPDRLAGLMVMYAILVFFGMIAITPFLWMISTSLMTLPQAQAARLLPDFNNLQWSNYQTAWIEANFDQYFTNSIVISAIAVVGTLLLCVMAAYAFARIDFWGRDLMFTLVLATLMIPESVTMIPNFLIVTANIFPLPNLIDVPPFVTIGWELTWMDTLQGLTVPFMASAFSIFLLRQFFAQIPMDLWDAARLDGSGHTRFLLQICLPIARPAIATVALLTFIGSWNAFLWPIIITRTDEWRPVVVGLYNFTTEGSTQNHLQMAAAFIAILPMLVLYFIAQKSFTEGLATSGLKG
jgi:ABC-type glycerol-3-phosphate transport system permease component